MAYTRKTKDVFEIQGFYCGAWECVTSEETHKEARQQLKTYRENERGTAFRIKIVREKIV